MKTTEQMTTRIIFFLLQRKIGFNEGRLPVKTRFFYVLSVITSLYFFSYFVKG